ncbi:hypothetical protein [Rhodohalobacter sulfatireducens]|uniref:Curlin associated repeat-containing protein n=1 Tax=Rhodohalobacter sulfatireducens TaxID=2911366 RepID=A0ABS9KJ88_9BACT|nr:hypothetical protein [Rhodohalobacter sulfatireducens]MCG2590922.1 hypothetical protein [Rhodohalobacter sulfatireducens]
MKRIPIVLWFLFLLTGTIYGQSSFPDPGNEGVSNEAMIEQAGNSNTGIINQFGSNSAYIEQVGDNNRAVIQQGGGESLGKVIDTPIGSSFPGDFGGFGHKQTTSTADLTQSGDFNDAFVVQAGSHSSRIVQDGRTNFAGITQFSFRGGLFDSFSKNGNAGSVASIIQEGSYNEAGIGQLGNAHDGTIEQYGDHNKATIAQLPGFGLTGGDNPVFNLPVPGGSSSGATGTIIQHGNWNEASIIQNSSSIPTEIIQYGYETNVMVEHNPF